MTTKILEKNSRAQFSKVFSLFDDNRKGYTTAENLVRVAETLGEQIKIAEIGEMIKRADLDSDSVVSEEEFYAIMTKKLWGKWYTYDLFWLIILANVCADNLCLIQ